MSVTAAFVADDDDDDDVDVLVLNGSNKNHAATSIKRKRQQPPPRTSMSSAPIVSTKIKNIDITFAIRRIQELPWIMIFSHLGVIGEEDRHFIRIECGDATSWYS